MDPAANANETVLEEFKSLKEHDKVLSDVWSVAPRYFYTPIAEIEQGLLPRAEMAGAAELPAKDDVIHESKKPRYGLDKVEITSTTATLESAIPGQEHAQSRGILEKRKSAHCDAGKYDELVIESKKPRTDSQGPGKPPLAPHRLSNPAITRLEKSEITLDDMRAVRSFSNLSDLFANDDSPVCTTDEETTKAIEDSRGRRERKQDDDVERLKKKERRRLKESPLDKVGMTKSKETSRADKNMDKDSSAQEKKVSFNKPDHRYLSKRAAEVCVDSNFMVMLMPKRFMLRKSRSYQICDHGTYYNSPFLPAVPREISPERSPDRKPLIIYEKATLEYPGSEARELYAFSAQATV